MTQNSILITGAAGFVGRHMAALLVERGYRVFALDREMPEDAAPGCECLAADLERPETLRELPREWFGVIHLAGASVPGGFSSPAPVLSNLQLAINLLDHLKSGRVLLVSSCHVYAPSRQRHREEDPVVPQGRYGLSKHLLEQLAPHYLPRLDVRVARPFNHLGPGQRPELVIPSLLERLSGHPKDDPSPVVMRGINSVRDFIDVRDVVGAYLAILALDGPEERTFNVCTGEGRSIESVILAAQELLGTKRPVRFENHPNSLDDIPHLVGDPGRLMRASGWKPERGLSMSLQSMIEALHA